MKKHYRAEKDCLNCNTALEGKFCHNCGQENLQIKESFSHMMNHAISDYFHFDHQFFHTLKPLLFKPGFLTNEYMAGRRVQYLHPIKMYIFISIVYFLLLFQSGTDNNSKVNVNVGKPFSTQKVIDSVNTAIANDPGMNPGRKKELQKRVAQYTVLGAKFQKDSQSKLFIVAGDSTMAQYAGSQRKLHPSDQDGFLIRKFKQKIFTFNEKYGQRAKEEFWDEAKHNIPKMMFVMLPVFAFILWVAFWKNKKYYVEHLIYAFHLFCFLFLFLGIIMIVEIFIPAAWGLTGWIGALSAIYIIGYIFKSLRVVYRRNRFRTITKIMGMSFVYFFMSLIWFMLVLVITAITAI